MKLGVNGIRLCGRRTGVGRVIEAILRCMDEVDHPFEEVRVYSPEPIDPAIKLPAAGRNVVIRSRMPPALWEQYLLRRAHGPTDLLFCPSYIAPLWTRCPVLLGHLGSYEGYPQAFSWWELNKARMIYALSARSATQVCTLSEHSRRDIVRYYGVSPEKLHVIPVGVDTGLFRPLNDARVTSQWRMERFGADIPFIVYVGKPTRRRNLPELIEAFARLKREMRVPHKLALVGVDLAESGLGQVARQHGIDPDVVGITHTTHEEMTVIYNASDMLVYPSSYEGFGLPVLEAMACGTPAIALNNTAFPEFSGGIALLLEDAAVDTLVRGISTVLSDADLRARMRTDGPRRAADYEWKVLTRQYVALMRETAEIGSRSKCFRNREVTGV